jgi:peptidoglycan/xylan/chitin deacetylase (PgdA/CDA1 family)
VTALAQRPAASSATTVAVSVDLDAPQDYAEFYGKPWGLAGDRFLAGVLPAFLELFASLGVRATFFAIARNARSPEGARWHRALVEAGHEVANHTLSHVIAFRSLDEAARRREIGDARAILEDATGQPVVGFRAPAYDVDGATLEILLEHGYRYDSSLNPTPFLVPMKWIIRALARRRRVGLGTWSQRFAAATPHWYWRATHGAPALRRAVGPPPAGIPGLLELPLTTVPPLRFPFYGTITQILGPRWFAWALAAVRRQPQAINYELHALELGATGPAEDLAALRNVPGYGKDGARKAAVLRDTLHQLAAGSTFVTLAELAALWAADQAPAVGRGELLTRTVG